MSQSDCWICGADVRRICWCHDGDEPGLDGQPCRCRPNIVDWSPYPRDLLEVGE